MKIFCQDDKQGYYCPNKHWLNIADKIKRLPRLRRNAVGHQECTPSSWVWGCASV